MKKFKEYKEDIRLFVNAVCDEEEFDYISRCYRAIYCTRVYDNNTYYLVPADEFEDDPEKATFDEKVKRYTKRFLEMGGTLPEIIDEYEAYKQEQKAKKVVTKKATKTFGNEVLDSMTLWEKYGKTRLYLTEKAANMIGEDIQYRDFFIDMATGTAYCKTRFGDIKLTDEVANDLLTEKEINTMKALEELI